MQTRRTCFIPLASAVLALLSVLLLPTAAAAADHASRPGAIDLPSYGESLTQMLTVLAVVVGVLLLLPKVLPRFIKTLKQKGAAAGRKPASLIEVIDTRPMGKGRSLCVVRVGRRHFLVTSTEQGLGIANGVDLSVDDLRPPGNPPEAEATTPSTEPTKPALSTSFLDMVRQSPAT